MLHMSKVIFILIIQFILELYHTDWAKYIHCIYELTFYDRFLGKI